MAQSSGQQVATGITGSSGKYSRDAVLDIDDNGASSNTFSLLNSTHLTVDVQVLTGTFATAVVELRGEIVSGQYAVLHTFTGVDLVEDIYVAPYQSCRLVVTTPEGGTGTVSIARYGYYRPFDRPGRLTARDVLTEVSSTGSFARVEVATILLEDPVGLHTVAGGQVTATRAGDYCLSGHVNIGVLAGAGSNEVAVAIRRNSAAVSTTYTSIV